MKSRRIYYVPGMISLIFLPILCVWYLEKNKKIERCIEISYASKYDKISDYHRFDTSSLSLPENKRVYTDIYLSGDESRNQIVFNSLTEKLDSILKNKNRKTGIHISFSDECSYNSYVRSLDIIESCFKMHSAYHTYCPYQNNIWVFYYRDMDDVRIHEDHYIQYYNEDSNKKDGSKNNQFLYIVLINILLFISIISMQYTFKNYIKTNHKQQ